MKAGWQINKLGEVCEIVNGGTPKTTISEYWGGKNLWITPAEMGNRLNPYVEDTERKITDYGLVNSSARILPEKSVILSSRAPIGHVVINVHPMATNQGCKGLVPTRNIHYKFLYYYLVSIVRILDSLGTGATFKELSGAKLKDIQIPYPDYYQQRRIVAILDEAFAGISAAKESAEKNLKNANEVFEALLQDTFLNNDGWEEKPIKKIGVTQTGITPQTSDKENYGDYIPFIKPADIDFDGFGSINYSNFSLSEKGLLSGRLIPKNSVLMVCIGASIGKTGFSEQDVSCNQQINSLTLNSNFEPKFFYYALKTRLFFKEVILNSAQATLPIINKSKWENITVKYPKSVAEQRRIVSQFESITAETSRLESVYQQKLANLEELKKSILHKAFSGAL